MKFGIGKSTEMCRRCLIPFQIEQQFPLMRPYLIFCSHMDRSSLKPVLTEEQILYPQHKCSFQAQYTTTGASRNFLIIK
jgi:hypothetical protein